MEITGVLALGVSIVLFAITLIIILALRKADQNNRRLGTVKKMVEKLEADTRKTMDEFKQELAEIEVEISKKEDNLHNLIQSGTSQINALSSYYDDFGNLSSAMQTYKKALEGVQRLTESTDDKIAQLGDDVNRLEEVKQLIQSFRDDIDNIRQSAVEQVENATSDSENRMSSAVESLKSESAILKESFRTDVNALIDSNADRIQNIVSTYVEEINDKISQMNQVSTKLAAQLEQLQAAAEHEPEPVSAPVEEPVAEPAPEPEPQAAPEVSVETQFDIQDMDYDIEPEPEFEPEPQPIPEPVREPVREPERKNKFEYTGEDEEVIFS